MNCVDKKATVGDKAVFEWSRRSHHRLRDVVLVAMSVLLCGQASCQAHEPDGTVPSESLNRPDILFIAIDDLNDCVGALEGQYRAKTPNIDALAARGMIFTNAHAPGASCTPTRTAVLTGMSPFSSGLYSHHIDWRKTPVVRDVVTLPRHFRNNGYHTIGAGKIFHAHTYTIRGAQGQQDTKAWDAYFPSLKRQLPDEIYPVDGQNRSAGVDNPVRGGGKKTGWFDFHPVTATDDAMGDGQIASWIVNQLQSPVDGPRFTAVGIYRPHLPWYTPEKYFDLHPIDQIKVPPYLKNDRDDIQTGIEFNREPGLGWNALPQLSEPSEQVTGAMQAYLASVSFSDAMVGRVIEGLDQSGRANKTIIVLWSDHGFHLGEKDTWGKFTLWERTTHVPLIIVAPGITQAGSKSDEAVSLQSIYPTLADLTGLSLPEHVDGNSLRPLLGNPAAEWPEVAITTVEHGSYTVRDDHYRYIVYQKGGEELYDHRVDPNEWTNLASDPMYADILDRLRRKLPPVEARALPPQLKKVE